MAARPSGSAAGHDTSEKPAAGKASTTAFERRDIIDEVKKYFQPPAYCSPLGRVVLYGGSGLGKSRIARQVAREVTRANGRRIFTINALSIVTYICDYCSLYYELTGEHLPRGLGLRFAIPVIKRLLESRSDEFFLLVTNLGTYIEHDPNLVNSLPIKGQILITSVDLEFPKEQLDGKQVKIGPHTVAVSALQVARTSTQVYAKGLFDREVQQLARQLCPKLLNISWNEFGKLQRWARAAPLFLRVTMMNLRLLRLEFAAYRDQFERRFNHSQIDDYQRLGWYTTAFNVACGILWDALGDHDRYAQRLLALLAMVSYHPIDVRLLAKLSVFSNTVTDELTPALDLLVSHGLVSIFDVHDAPHVIIFHQDLTRWVYKHLVHCAKSDPEYHMRLVEAWAILFDQELSNGSPTASYPPYAADKLWSLYPLANAHVTTMFHMPRYPPPASEPIVNYLVNIMESAIYHYPLVLPPGFLLDESHPVLLSIRFKIPAVDYNSYYLRIRLCRMETHLMAHELMEADTYLRQARRSLRLLEIEENDPPELVESVWSDGEASIDFVGHQLLMSSASSSSQNLQSRAVHITRAHKEKARRQSPSLLILQRRTEDLEISLRLAQKRFANAEILLLNVVDPPTPTSLSDPFVLAQRYCWTAQAIDGDLTNFDLNSTALRYSHAAMGIWAELSDAERWASRGGTDTKVLDWVMCHVDLLMKKDKFRGALVFLPRLFETSMKLCPSTRNCRLANQLVECYINVDQVEAAESVVEKILEFVKGTAFGAETLSGLRDVRDSQYPEDDDMKTVWETLIALAQGYGLRGSFAAAEGLIRFSLGSWRRRQVGSYEEVVILEMPNATPEQLEEARIQEEEKNTRAREARDERERTWKATAPMRWWEHLIEVLVSQHRVNEARQLVGDLRSSFKGRRGFTRYFRNAFTRRLETMGKMRDVYQKAMWAEEDGHLQEWKAFLGETRERSLLRAAVKTWGSVSQRVKSGKDFVSDLDTTHGSSNAGDSRILHLIDRKWGHGGFSSRLALRNPNYVQDVATLRVHNHRPLCHVWRWCQCRNRRSRAFSLEWPECNDKWWIGELERRTQKVKSLRQTTLDNWIYVIIDTPRSRHPRCKPDCPCINSNLRGLAEQAALEAKLWTYTEPSDPYLVNPKKKNSKGPHRKKARKSTCNELEALDMAAGDTVPSFNDIIEQGTEFWEWAQPEFNFTDRENENFIIPNAKMIPTITLTCPANEVHNKANSDAVETKAQPPTFDMRWYAGNWFVDSSKHENILKYVVLADDVREKYEMKRNMVWFLEEGLPREIGLPPGYKQNPENDAATGTGFESAFEGESSCGEEEGKDEIQDRDVVIESEVEDRADEDARSNVEEANEEGIRLGTILEEEEDEAQQNQDGDGAQQIHDEDPTNPGLDERDDTVIPEMSGALLTDDLVSVSDET